MEAQRALVSQSNLKKKENQCLISNYTTEPQQRNKTKQNKTVKYQQKTGTQSCGIKPNCSLMYTNPSQQGRVREGGEGNVVGV